METQEGKEGGKECCAKSCCYKALAAVGLLLVGGLGGFFAGRCCWARAKICPPSAVSAPAQPAK